MWRKPSDIAHWIAGCWDEKCIDLAVRGYIAGYGHDRYWGGTSYRPRERACERSNERHTNTGWTGQVVAGLRMNGKTVPEPVAGRFPDILEDKDEITPSGMACSQVIASEPQRLITNRFAAQAVAGYLNELFGERTLSTHVTFLHAKKMYMRGERITEG